MFRKIILGYYYSPSLGDKLVSFEKDLRKKLRWQIASLFSALLFFFLCFFVVSLPFKNASHNGYTPIERIASSADLDLSSKIVYAPEKRIPGSEIVFQLKIKNTSNEPQIVDFKFQSSDILEYATILNQKGLTVGEKYAQWSDSELQPGETDIREFSVRLKDKIPVHRQNKTSYDYAIEFFFGNSTKLAIDRPIAKSLDELLEFSKKIDVNITTLLICVVVFLTSLSLLRTKLLLKQIKSIKLQERLP
ncbi:MAG: hypothetical protein Q4A27_02390 [bacterium]|nr:hypothetical protein [bacterium]